MIGITLGLLVTAGAVSIFIGNKRAFRAQDSASQLQESARYGINYLAQTLRSADLWSGVDPAFISVGTNSIIGPKLSKSCTGSWIANPREGLRGYQGASMSPVDCVVTSDYVQQSDMIAIRRIDPDTFATAEDIKKEENSNRNYLRSRVGIDGYIYQGSKISEADQHIPGGNGVLNYAYDFQLLFLRPCNIKDDGRCNSKNHTPTLTSLQLQSDGQLSQVALVQNVEQMKFEFGVDTNSDQIVDTYQQANNVLDWSRVLSVRANLIVRGDALDHFRDTQSYPMGIDFCHGPATSSCQSKYSGYEGYQRRLVTQDILIRNRAAR